MKSLLVRLHVVEGGWSAYIWRTVSLFVIQNKSGLLTKSNKLLHSSNFNLPNCLLVIYTDIIGDSTVIHSEDV